MDSVKSFKGYGKVDEAEDLALRKRARRRLIILIISAVVLVMVIIGAVVGFVLHRRSSESAESLPSPTELTPAASLRTICSVTQYPSSCFSSISKLDLSNTSDPEILFKLSLKVAVNELQSLSGLPAKLAEATEDQRIKSALTVCGDLFDDALDRLNDSVSSMEVGNGGKTLNSSKIDDLKTWLSTVITDHDSCVDALEELRLNNTVYSNSTIVRDLKSAMENSMEFASNSLAIVAKVLGLLGDFGIPIHRRLLGFNGGDSLNPASYPNWVSPGVRRLLQESNPTPNVTVATDGSGDVKTINEAVAKVQKKSKSMFVIHVKAGVYTENVVMDKGKWNVMIYGDGKTKTIISGSKNFIDGTATYETATFAIQGKGFVAKDIGFKNTAGAIKHQAVAFRSGSDLSVYYRCSFDGYQDTLYAHSNRQFYRECDVTGTIDFIFGNAAVVLQNCNIQPRQPLANQFNTITAQGKKDPNQNTGISIHKCSISANGNLTATTFLGRPWKEFSTTVVMQSEIGGFLNAVGWKEWVSGVDPPSTILYGEYRNTGPGSDVTRRVKWAGYKPVLTDMEAGKFTVGTFIQGNEWLPATQVSFEQSL